MTATFNIIGHISQISDPTDPNEDTSILHVRISTPVPKKGWNNGIFTVTFTDNQIEDVLTFVENGHLKVRGDILQFANENGTVVTYYFVKDYEYCPF